MQLKEQPRRHLYALEVTVIEGAVSGGVVSALEVTLAEEAASERLIPALELTTDADEEKE